MNKIISISILFVLIFSSCEENEPNTGLLGTWEMINYNGGLLGISENVPKGTFSLTFTTKSVTVKNNSLPFNWIEEGTYSYSINQVGEEMGLSVDDTDLGILKIEKSTLSVDQRSFDGFQYVFSK